MTNQKTIDPAYLKKCMKCGVYKQPEQYYRHKDAIDGLEYWCIPCMQVRNDRENAIMKAAYALVGGHKKYKKLSKASKKLARAAARAGAEWTTESPMREKAGVVYVITNPAWPDWYKVGKSNDSNSRLKGYQTYTPFRDFEVYMKSPVVPDCLAAEKLAHRRLTIAGFRSLNEWFFVSPEHMPILEHVIANSV